MVIFLFTNQAYADDEDIETNIHLLMDLSTSYYGKGTIAENKRALKESFKVIRNIAKSDIDRPAIIQVLGITEESAGQKLIFKNEEVEVEDLENYDFSRAKITFFFSRQ